MLTKYEVEDSVEDLTTVKEICKSAVDTAMEQARQNVLEYIRNAETLQISANEVQLTELTATPIRIDTTPYVHYAEIGGPISVQEYRVIYDEPITYSYNYEPYTADMANNLISPRVVRSEHYDVQPERWHYTPLASI